MKKLLLLAATIATVLCFMLPTPSATAAGVAKSIKFPCKEVGRAQLDPIVNPDGSPSAHLHMFAGNKGIPTGVHTYEEAIKQATSCTFAGDTAGYWVAPMIDAMGKVIPAKIVVYYDRMSSQRITPFPPNFRMIWGFTKGIFSSKQRSYYGWNCDNNEPLKPDFSMVDCRGMPSNNVVTFRAFSPFCWDGQHIDSVDHTSHVTYPPNYPTNNTCPTGTVAVPRLRVNFNFQTQYCPTCNITSDMMLGGAHGSTAHTDFWNTWQQSALEGLVADLNMGASSAALTSPTMTMTTTTTMPPPPMTTTTMTMTPTMSPMPTEEPHHT